MSLSFCASAFTLSSRTAARFVFCGNSLRVHHTPIGVSRFAGRHLGQRTCYALPCAATSNASSRKLLRAIATSIEPPLQNSPSPDAVDALQARFRDISSSSQPQSDMFEKIIKDEYPFQLDDFQLNALAALVKGESVVLSAPTGAGKTIVGEMAVYLALCKNLRVFYTTPLKALSNQKFYDFKKQFGEHRVGLLTGDVTVNREADVVVMTTEVYRNMLYGDSSEANGLPITDNLFAVIFDEFHYLNDRNRGTVWEESVISSPEHVLLVALSATMSNTADVKEWFCNVQGPTRLIESVTRPVPLNFAYCDRDGMTPLFASEQRKRKSEKKRGFAKKVKGSEKGARGTELKLHPELLRRLKKGKEENTGGRRRQSSQSIKDISDPTERMRAEFRAIADSKRNRRDRYAEIPSYPFVVRSLRRRDMLPCIVFIFSRAGCDRAAVAAATERTELVSEDEKKRIRERLDAFVAANPGMVKPDRMNLALQGIASHHAGLLPLWKLCVEELFQDGLIKVVFATETLAAGINMPARSTVISTLSKRAGEAGIVSLTTSEVLQMAGRAGRRGKDIVGHCAMLRSRNEGAMDAFKVLTTDVDALESKFSPSYGMVLNLLSARPLEDAKKLVDRSFGNFLRQKELQEHLKGRKDKDGTDVDVGTLLREKAALESVLEESRSIVGSVDEKELRSYIKAIERIKAEKRALSYLVQQSTDMDAELIEETLAFAPAGTRLLLKERKKVVSTGVMRRRKRREYSSAIAAAAEGDLGEQLQSFYLEERDAELEEINEGVANNGGSKGIEAVLVEMHSDSVGVLPMFTAVDACGRLRIFNHRGVDRVFFDEDVVEVETMVENWEELSLPERSEWESIGGEQFEAKLPEELGNVVEVVKSWREERRGVEGFENGGEKGREHGEVFAQKQRVLHAQDLVRQHVLHGNEKIEKIVAAKRAIPNLEATLDGSMDPFGEKKRKGGKGGLRYRSLDGEDGKIGEGMGRNGCWEEFMAIANVLQHYGFLDEQYNVTSLGEVGAKVRAENELWTSIVLMQPSLQDVSPAHLGAILGATQMEGGRADVYVEKEISEETKRELNMANAERIRLCGIQQEYGVDGAVSMDGDLMGLVETWATGVSWMELMSGTSLQEGDACRILRRVMDLLRQVKHLPMISEEMKRNSKRAVTLLDRFPVTDDRTYVVRADERVEDAKE